MSIYESDPRARPASIQPYPRRRRPVETLPVRSARRAASEPSYADFFETPAGIAAGL